MLNLSNKVLGELTFIYLIRHGECKGNREGLFRGRCDFPLNEVGIKQAEALSEELKDVEFSAIYTSPLSRAYKTAEIVAQRHGLVPVVEEGFNNIKLGEWEGKPKDEIKRSYPEEWKLWIKTPEKLKLPESESIPQVKERAFKALKKVIAENLGKTIAVVSHRAVLKPLIAAILRIPEPYFWSIHVDTASYSIVTYNEQRGFCLTLLNQTKHLKDYVVELV